jgi:hypothetical protein
MAIFATAQARLEQRPQYQQSTDITDSLFQVTVNPVAADESPPPIFSQLARRLMPGKTVDGMAGLDK